MVKYHLWHKNCIKKPIASNFVLKITLQIQQIQPLFKNKLLSTYEIVGEASHKSFPGSPTFEYSQTLKSHLRRSRSCEFTKLHLIRYRDIFTAQEYTEFLQKQPYLTSVNFYGCGVSGADFVKSFARLRYLTYLNLSATLLPQNDLILLLDRLHKNPLTFLGIAENRYDEEIAPAIGSFIEKNTTIETCDLRWNYISDETLKAILKAFETKCENKKLPILPFINLRGCHFTQIIEEAYHKIFIQNCLSLGTKTQKPEHFQRLLKLGVQRCIAETIEDYLIKKSNVWDLCYMDAGDNRVDTITIASALQLFPISEIDLCESHISDSGLMLFNSIMAPNPYLKKIDLNSNKISNSPDAETGLGPVDQLIANCPNLTELNLLGNQIKLDGIKRILKRLSTNTNFYSLDINKNLAQATEGKADAPSLFTDDDFLEGLRTNFQETVKKVVSQL